MFFECKKLNISSECIDHFKNLAKFAKEKNTKQLNEELSKHSKDESPLLNLMKKKKLEKIFNNNTNDDDKYVYLTGQSACLKTTILNKLRDDFHLLRVSRSTAGSFAGKSKNATQKTNLILSLLNALKHEYVIGDRGFIDNMLWEILMPIFESKFDANDDVEQFLFWFVGNFNEHVISFLLYMQKPIILLDSNFNENKERLLKRGQAGDYQRARINCYESKQFLYYYFMAYLFGWPKFLLKYNNCSNNLDMDYFENYIYKNIYLEIAACKKNLKNFNEKDLEILEKSYNEKIKKLNKTTIAAAGNYCQDMSWAKSVSIYK